MRRWLKSLGGPPRPLGEAGQAVAEAALTIPILLFLLTGIFMAGTWFNAKLVATAAAREGARAGALTAEWRCVENAVMNAFSVIGETAPAITLSNQNQEEIGPDDPLPAPGANLTVRVEFAPRYPFSRVYDPTPEADNSKLQFGDVAESATARMEALPPSPDGATCQPLPPG